jgi:hypothetical protein
MVLFPSRGVNRTERAPLLDQTPPKPGSRNRGRIMNISQARASHRLLFVRTDRSVSRLADASISFKVTPNVPIRRSARIRQRADRRRLVQSSDAVR